MIYFPSTTLLNTCYSKVVSHTSTKGPRIDEQSRKGYQYER